MPLPVTGMELETPAPVAVRLPVATPFATGVNCTLKVQVPPGLTVAVAQVLLLTVKPAGTEIAIGLDELKVVPVLLVSVTGHKAVDVPTICGSAQFRKGQLK